MDETNWCTPGEACERLGLASSTLRTYAQQFDRLLSPGARGGARSDRGFSHRRYSPADLGVLEKVKRLVDAGLSYEAVYRELTGSGALSALPARRRQAARPRRPRSEPDRAMPVPPGIPEVAAAEPAPPDQAAVVGEVVRDSVERVLRDLDSAAAAELVALRGRMTAVEEQLAEQRRLAIELRDEVRRLRQEIEALGQLESSPEEPLPERRTWIGRIMRRE